MVAEHILTAKDGASWLCLGSSVSLSRGVRGRIIGSGGNNIRCIEAATHATVELLDVEGYAWLRVYSGDTDAAIGMCADLVSAIAQQER